MPEFSYDEINVMCIYDTGTRKGLIGELKETREYLDPDQTELRSCMDSCIHKLQTMTDEQYQEINNTFVPDFIESELMNGE